MSRKVRKRKFQYRTLQMDILYIAASCIFFYLTLELVVIVGPLNFIRETVKYFAELVG